MLKIVCLNEKNENCDKNLMTHHGFCKKENTLMIKRARLEWRKVWFWVSNNPEIWFQVNVESRSVVGDRFGFLPTQIWGGETEQRQVETWADHPLPTTHHPSPITHQSPIINNYTSYKIKKNQDQLISLLEKTRKKNSYQEVERKLFQIFVVIRKYCVIIFDQLNYEWESVIWKGMTGWWVVRIIIRIKLGGMKRESECEWQRESKVGE